MNKIVQLIDRFSLILGRSVAWLMFAMMALMFLVVVLRYLFNIGTIGLQESIVYLHGIIFMLAIGYTLRQKAHVRVDIFYQRLSERSRAIIDMLGTLLFLFPVCIFILWVSWDYVAFSFRLRESSPEPGGLPAVYLLKGLIPAMALLLAIQGVAELLRNLLIIMNKRAP